jgi:hypothetical protein
MRSGKYWRWRNRCPIATRARSGLRFVSASLRWLRAGLVALSDRKRPPQRPLYSRHRRVPGAASQFRAHAIKGLRVSDAKAPSGGAGKLAPRASADQRFGHSSRSVARSARAMSRRDRRGGGFSGCDSYLLSTDGVSSTFLPNSPSVISST